MFLTPVYKVSEYLTMSSGDPGWASSILSPYKLVQQHWWHLRYPATHRTLTERWPWDGLLLISLYRWWHWGSEQVNDFLRATKLKRNQAGTQIQVSRLTLSSTVATSRTQPLNTWYVACLHIEYKVHTRFWRLLNRKKKFSFMCFYIDYILKWQFWIHWVKKYIFLKLILFFLM